MLARVLDFFGSMLLTSDKGEDRKGDQQARALREPDDGGIRHALIPVRRVKAKAAAHGRLRPVSSISCLESTLFSLKTLTQLRYIAF